MSSNRFGQNDKCLNCVDYQATGCTCPNPNDIETAAKEMRAEREKLGIDGRAVTPSDVKTDSAWVIFLANEKLKATTAERVEQRSQA